MAPSVVQLLMNLDEDELLEMRYRLRGEVARGQVELEQVEEAITRKRGNRPTGTTRRRIIEIVGASRRPMRPAEIIAALRTQGPAPSGGAIHNMIGRLTKEGELAKVGAGEYELASRNGDPSGHTRNQSGDPLFRDTRSEEGT